MPKLVLQIPSMFLLLMMMVTEKEYFYSMHFHLYNSFHPAGDFQLSLATDDGALSFKEDLEQDIDFLLTLSRIDGEPVRLATRILFSVSTTGFPANVSGKSIQKFVNHLLNLHISKFYCSSNSCMSFGDVVQ